MKLEWDSGLGGKHPTIPPKFEFVNNYNKPISSYDATLIKYELGFQATYFPPRATCFPPRATCLLNLIKLVTIK